MAPACWPCGRHRAPRRKTAKAAPAIVPILARFDPRSIGRTPRPCLPRRAHAADRDGVAVGAEAAGASGQRGGEHGESDREGLLGLGDGRRANESKRARAGEATSAGCGTWRPSSILRRDGIGGGPVPTHTNIYREPAEPTLNPLVRLRCLSKAGMCQLPHGGRRIPVHPHPDMEWEWRSLQMPFKSCDEESVGIQRRDCAFGDERVFRVTLGGSVSTSPCMVNEASKPASRPARWRRAATRPQRSPPR